MGFHVHNRPLLGSEGRARWGASERRTLQGCAWRDEFWMIFMWPSLRVARKGNCILLQHCIPLQSHPCNQTGPQRCSSHCPFPTMVTLHVLGPGGCFSEAPSICPRMPPPAAGIDKGAGRLCVTPYLYKAGVPVPVPFTYTFLGHWSCALTWAESLSKGERGALSARSIESLTSPLSLAQRGTISGEFAGYLGV